MDVWREKSPRARRAATALKLKTWKTCPAVKPKFIFDFFCATNRVRAP